MTFESSIFEQLAAPFEIDEVLWRVGSTTKDKSKGKPLAYIDARHVMDRLDNVVGPADWRTEHESIGHAMVCRLYIRLDGEWIGKSDGCPLPPLADTATAQGRGEVSKIEQENEMAVKGAFSDAIKRAAVQWGIGRYLYSVHVPYVPINEWRQITDEGLKVCRDALLKAGKVHEWGDRNQANLWRVLSTTIRELAREPADIGRLLKANEGHVSLLKVAYRKQLDQLCERLSDELSGQARAA